MQATTRPDGRAEREFAESRTGRVGLRILFHVATIALGTLFVPLFWMLPAATATVASRLVEAAAARGYLAATGPAKERAWALFVAANMASAASATLVLALIWLWTDVAHNTLPLSLLFLLSFAVAIEGRQVMSLVMARQGLNTGLAIALSLHDVAVGPLPDAVDLATKLLPVLVLAASSLALTYWSARQHRDALLREKELEAARDSAGSADLSTARFVATIGHELRTPLNGILGMAQSLLTTTLLPEQRRQVEVLEESGRSMALLLDDILDFSKLAEGKLTISPAPDDLARTAEHLERLYAPLAAAKGLAFRVTLAPDVPPRLVYDGIRVRQCLSNLITNAIKFTGEGSVEVAISATPEPPGTARWRVTAVVRDSGIGIPAELQARLFQPYNQADGTIARRFGGTGLGLSITRQLAEAMGGSVSVESSPGRGSVFRLDFLAAADSPPAPAGEMPDLSEARVLVADDVETNRMLMRLLLQPLGIEVVEVADGTAALGALAAERFDAALIDLNMPGLDGAALARQIRAGAGGRSDLPLVAMTGDSAAVGLAPADDGFDAIVAKPIDRDHLRAAIEAAILRRTQRPEGSPGTTPA